MSNSVQPHRRQPTRLPPSLGFSRQEHWSGLSFPSPMPSWVEKQFSAVQFSLSVVSDSFSQSCPTLCNPMNCSMPGLPVHHRLSEFTQTHVHRVGDAIQPSHPLSSPSSGYKHRIIQISVQSYVVKLLSEIYSEVFK